MNAKLIHTTVTGIYTQGILQQVVVVVVAEEEGEGKEEQGRYEEEKDVEKSVGGFAPKPIIIMMEETGRLSHTEDMNHLPENRVSASAIATKHVSITTNVSSSTRQGAPPRISITASAPSVSPAPRTSCVNSNDGRRRGSSIVSSHNQLLRQTLKYKLFAMYAGVVVLDTVALILELLGLLGVNFALTFPDMDALAVLASSIHVLVSMQILERVRNGVLEINNKN